MNKNKQWWVDRPWRLIQTNLREIDMLDIRADVFVAELQKFHANVVMINTAGIIASYPTMLPFQFQSPYLKGDSLAEIIEACHRADIKVIARTDFSKVRRPIYETHPEWAYKSPKGDIVDYNGDVHVCINSEYQEHYALEIMKEAITALDVDGIFFNMGGYQVKDYSGNYYGICHCDSCKRKFREMFRLSLPQAEDMRDPAYRSYLLFKKETLRQSEQRVVPFLHSIRPELCIANQLGLKQGIFRKEANTALDRPLPHWQYSASDITKWAVSSYPDMISSVSTVDFIDYPYRHVAVSPHQQRLRLAQNMANGGAIDYYLIGRLDNHEDRSGYEGIKEMFRYRAEHEEEYRSIVSAAKIAVLNDTNADQREFRGWFRILAEHHFLFDTLSTQAVLDLPLDKYTTVIIPAVELISQELAAKLDAFVEHGGTLICVGKSGVYDENYDSRSKPALHCLGIREYLLTRTDTRSTYFRVDEKQIFKRFPATDLVYMDSDYIYADYKTDVQPYTRMIPPHMFGPPERCYYTEVTDHPGFTVSGYGKGKGVFIPWKPGEMFHRQGYTNTSDFVADVLEYVSDCRPLGGNLPPMVEATVFVKKDRPDTLVHMVNASGHFGVSFYAPVQMTGLEVSLPLSDQPRSVTSVLTGQACSHRWEDGVLTLHIGRLDLFEAIKITV